MDAEQNTCTTTWLFVEESRLQSWQGHERRFEMTRMRCVRVGVGGRERVMMSKKSNQICRRTKMNVLGRLARRFYR